MGKAIPDHAIASLLLRQVNRLRGVIPGLTRNPVTSWIMNIKLRFPASAGITVLRYIVAGVILVAKSHDFG
jgi:hypothetical protein